MPKDALPAPADLYFEIECAKAHGGWAAWVGLPADVKGRLLAHEYEKNMRDHYYLECKKTEKPKESRPETRTVMDSIRERFFNKPKP